jgi:hypothetical protein
VYISFINIDISETNDVSGPQNQSSRHLEMFGYSLVIVSFLGMGDGLSGVDEKRQHLEGKCSNFGVPEGQVYKRLPRRVFGKFVVCKFQVNQSLTEFDEEKKLTILG